MSDMFSYCSSLKELICFDNSIRAVYNNYVYN